MNVLFMKVLVKFNHAKILVVNVLLTMMGKNAKIIQTVFGTVYHHYAKIFLALILAQNVVKVN